MAKLNKEQVEALRAIRHGADVTSKVLGRTLRGIEKDFPTLLEIGDVMGNYDGAGMLPLFGAIITREGFELLAAEMRFRTPGVCKVCGCTDDDCEGCVIATGGPCSWADETDTVCTACLEPGETVLAAGQGTKQG